MKPYFNPKWKYYAAQIAVRAEVQGDSKAVICIKTYLISADSPEEALIKAKELEDDEYKYRNSDGNVVTLKCIGVHDIDVIQEETLDDKCLMSVFSMIDGEKFSTDTVASDENDLSIFDVGNPRKFPNMDQ